MVGGGEGDMRAGDGGGAEADPEKSFWSNAIAGKYPGLAIEMGDAERF
jgi:hypothetical protein